MNELEFVFNKIIEIDKKSNDIKVKTSKEITDKELDLRNEVQALEDTGLKPLKAELEERYSRSIKEAESTAKRLLEESEKQAEQIIENYNLKKNQLKEKIFIEIIKPN